MCGHEAYVQQKRNAYKVLVGKFEDMRPFEENRARWEVNIKSDLRKERSRSWDTHRRGEAGFFGNGDETSGSTKPRKPCKTE